MCGLKILHIEVEGLGGYQVGQTDGQRGPLHSIADNVSNLEQVVFAFGSRVGPGIALKLFGHPNARMIKTRDSTLREYVMLE